LDLSNDPELLGSAHLILSVIFSQKDDSVQAKQHYKDAIKFNPSFADNEDPITTIPAYTGPGPLFNFSSHPDSMERARRLDKLLR